MRTGCAAALVLTAISLQAQTFADAGGIYAWGQLRAGVDDPLRVAADDVASLGAKNFRTMVGPYWDPRGVDDFTPLIQKIQRDDYAYAIRQFPVVMLTAYDTASFDPVERVPLYRVPVADPAAAGIPPLRRRPIHRLARSRLQDWKTSAYRPLSEGQAQSPVQWQQVLVNVEQEFFDLAYELSKVSGTTFYIGNWESENDAPDALWGQYLQYIQARLSGTVRGRDAASRDGYPAQVFTAFEFRNVLPGFQVPGLEPRVHAGFPSAMHDLGGVEFLSYSSWESINSGDPRGQLAQAFQEMRAECQAAGLPCRILIGELGYLRDLDPGNQLLQTALSACLEQGAQLVFNWVAYDQPGEGVVVDGVSYDQSQWGKWDSSGTLTSQGQAVRDWLQKVP